MIDRSWNWGHRPEAEAQWTSDLVAESPALAYPGLRAGGKASDCRWLR